MRVKIICNLIFIFSKIKWVFHKVIKLNFIKYVKTILAHKISLKPKLLQGN